MHAGARPDIRLGVEDERAAERRDDPLGDGRPSPNPPGRRSVRKKRSKTRARSLAFMPEPESHTSISAIAPRSRPVSRISPTLVWVAAFTARFHTAWRRRSASASIATPGSQSTRTTTPLLGSSSAASSASSGSTSTRASDGRCWPVWMRASSSSAATSLASRPVSRSMWPRKSSRSSGTSLAPAFRTSSALVIAAIGVRSSCAAFEANSRSARRRRSRAVTSCTSSSALSSSPGMPSSSSSRPLAVSTTCLNGGSGPNSRRTNVRSENDGSGSGSISPTLDPWTKTRAAGFR